MKSVLCVILMVFLIAQPYLSFRPEEKTDLKDLKIQVEVKGEVNNPGIFVLDQGSCMKDLLLLLDLTDKADTDSINSLIPLKDQDLILIEEKKSTEAKNALVSLNHATKEELMTLPGIGEKTAEAILDHRNRNGFFQRIEDLMQVKGIGQKKWEKIKPYVRL